MKAKAKPPKKKPRAKAILSTVVARKSSTVGTALNTAGFKKPDPQKVRALLRKIDAIRRAALRAGLDEDAEDRALARFGPVEKLHWPSEVSVRTFSLKKRGRKTANA
jgi:hypothetical protein